MSQHTADLLKEARTAWSAAAAEAAAAQTLLDRLDFRTTPTQYAEGNLTEARRVLKARQSEVDRLRHLLNEERKAEKQRGQATDSQSPPHKETQADEPKPHGSSRSKPSRRTRSRASSSLFSDPFFSPTPFERDPFFNPSRTRSRTSSSHSSTSTSSTFTNSFFWSSKNGASPHDPSTNPFPNRPRKPPTTGSSTRFHRTYSPPRTPAPSRKRVPRTDDVERWKARVDAAFADLPNLVEFPEPPFKKCARVECQGQRSLRACRCCVERAFRDRKIFPEGVRRERLRWHPDRFAVCGEGVRAEMQGKAQEVFVVVNEIWEEERESS
ncbi:MAG: hypothetical protein MMC23_002387 [Stictis urceolatum]|nr:hypothetical protein [Stictis urceolata]